MVLLSFNKLENLDYSKNIIIIIVSVVSKAKVEKKLNRMAQPEFAMRNPSLSNLSVLSCGEKQLENHVRLDSTWQNSGLVIYVFLLKFCSR